MSNFEGKHLVIKKANKGNTAVIADDSKYLKWMKSLFSDSSKFMHLPLIKVSG